MNRIWRPLWTSSFLWEAHSEALTTPSGSFSKMPRSTPPLLSFLTVFLSPGISGQIWVCLLSLEFSFLLLAHNHLSIFSGKPFIMPFFHILHRKHDWVQICSIDWKHDSPFYLCVFQLPEDFRISHLNLIVTSMVLAQLAPCQLILK